MLPRSRKRPTRPPAKSSPAPEPERASPGLCPIVGMGASAGGLEAFQRFFSNLPADNGTAFVLVQHLDPRHATLLPELLGKSTQMLVEQVKDERPVQPNNVYVI